VLWDALELAKQRVVAAVANEKLGPLTKPNGFAREEENQRARAVVSMRLSNLTPRGRGRAAEAPREGHGWQVILPAEAPQIGRGRIVTLARTSRLLGVLPHGSRWPGSRPVPSRSPWGLEHVLVAGSFATILLPEQPVPGVSRKTLSYAALIALHTLRSRRVP
jgi:hypothetical protein